MFTTVFRGVVKIGGPWGRGQCLHSLLKLLFETARAIASLVYTLIVINNSTSGVWDSRSNSFTCLTVHLFNFRVWDSRAKTHQCINQGTTRALDLWREWVARYSGIAPIQNFCLTCTQASCLRHLGAWSFHSHLICPMTSIFTWNWSKNHSHNKLNGKQQLLWYSGPGCYHNQNKATSLSPLTK